MISISYLLIMCINILAVLQQAHLFNRSLVMSTLSRILRGVLSQRRLLPIARTCPSVFSNKNKELPWDSLAGKMEPRRRVTSQVSGESLDLLPSEGP